MSTSSKPKRRMILLISLCTVAVLILGIGSFLHSARFGRLPQGDRLERIKRSPHYRDGQFHNLQPTTLMTGQTNRWKAMWKFISSDDKNLRPDTALIALKTDLKHLPQGRDLMVWFGHSSYLLQLAGRRYLVDPVFYAASPVSFINKPFEGTDLYRPEDMPDIDYLVISHDHWDHLDYRTVRELRPRVGKVICPLGVGEHFERWGYRPEQLIELDWMESQQAEPELTIHCLPARHFSGRGLTANRTLWASFLLDTPTLTVFVGGDSGYGNHFKEIARRHPHIDWAILENGQYNEDWRYIHTLPQQLPRVVSDLRVRNVVTVHHSKYALARHPWDEPIQNIRRLQADSTLHVAQPIIGEVLMLQP